MKKHLIPILIIFLLLLAGLLLVLGAMLTFELGRMDGTALALAAIMPCFYGPAVALLIPLHRRRAEVPRGYAWLGVVAFSVAVVGFAFTAVAYYGAYMLEIDPWMMFCWAAWGLLLPFFVSSVAHLKEPKPEKTPEDHRRMKKRWLIVLSVCLGVVLLTGGGLFLHKMREPHHMKEAQERAMYLRFRELSNLDDTWKSVDRVTHISAKEDGSDWEERVLEGEERAAMVRLCRELIRPVPDREEWYMGAVVPRKRMQYLSVEYPGGVAPNMIVDGEIYGMLQCVLKEYADAREVQVEYIQGETRHAVILRWEDE